MAEKVAMSSYGLARFHSDRDVLINSIRRRDVALLAAGGLIVVQLFAIVAVVHRDKPVYVVAVAPDGQEYVISSPKKAVSLRDAVFFNQTKQDLTSWATSYFRRNHATGAQDYERARWFMTDDLLSKTDGAARGRDGWLAKLMMGQLPECDIHIDSVILRDADIKQPPYQGTVLYTKVLSGGVKEHWRSDITFYVDPAQVKGPVPLYNAIGLFISNVQETQIFQ